MWATQILSSIQWKFINFKMVNQFRRDIFYYEIRFKFYFLFYFFCQYLVFEIGF